MIHSLCNPTPRCEKTPVLAFDPNLTLTLTLTLPVTVMALGAGLDGAQEPFMTIRLLQTDGKENLLRGSKVDRVIKWINLLARVSIWMNGLSE
jgi:hypothetical protein